MAAREDDCLIRSGSELVDGLVRVECDGRPVDALAPHPDANMRVWVDAVGAQVAPDGWRPWRSMRNLELANLRLVHDASNWLQRPLRCFSFRCRTETWAAGIVAVSSGEVHR